MNTSRYSNWAEDISSELEQNGETWADVISHTLTAEQMEKRFDHENAGSNVGGFVLWTNKYVYFPLFINKTASVNSVPRNPQSQSE